MTNFKSIAALSLAALVASTSLATAVDNWGIGKPLPDLPGDKPIVFIPIKVEPEKPQVPYIPIDIEDPDEDDDPQIPYVPGLLDLGGEVEDPVIQYPFGKPTKSESVVMALDCSVADPLGSTDHFWIVNAGNVALPGGLKIRYRVKATGDHGAFLLPRQVAVGGKLLIPNLLHDAPDGAPCTAQIIG